MADAQQEIMRAVDDIPEAVAQKINVLDCSHSFFLSLPYLCVKAEAGKHSWFNARANIV